MATKDSKKSPALINLRLLIKNHVRRGLWFSYARKIIIMHLAGFVNFSLLKILWSRLLPFDLIELFNLVKTKLLNILFNPRLSANIIILLFSILDRNENITCSKLVLKKYEEIFLIQNLDRT